MESTHHHRPAQSARPRVKSVSSSPASEEDAAGSDPEILAYVEKFKHEVEEKHHNSKTNRNFQFPRTTGPPSGRSYDSLEGVRFYDLESQNVKNELKRVRKDPRKSETAVLLETVTLIGRLDTRYLETQLQNIRSPLFRLLLDGVHKKLMKERGSMDSFKSSATKRPSVTDKRTFQGSSSGTLNHRAEGLLSERGPRKQHTERDQDRSKDKAIPQATGRYLAGSLRRLKYPQLSEESSLINSFRDRHGSNTQTHCRENSGDAHCSRSRMQKSTATPLATQHTNSAVPKTEIIKRVYGGQNLQLILQGLRKAKSPGVSSGNNQNSSATSATARSNSNPKPKAFLKAGVNPQSSQNSRPIFPVKGDSTLSKSQLRSMILKKISPPQCAPRECDGPLKEVPYLANREGKRSNRVEQHLGMASGNSQTRIKLKYG